MQNNINYEAFEENERFFLSLPIPFIKLEEDVFKKYGFKNNAYAWQTILNIFLKKEEELLSQIIFNSEPKKLIAECFNENSRNELLSKIQMLVSNEENLKDILKKLDEEEMIAFAFLSCEIVLDDEYMAVELGLNYVNKHKSIFERYEIDYDGYNWQVLLARYIELFDPNLTEKIAFDSESSTCIVYAENKKNIYKLAAYLHRIWQDANLVEYIFKNTNKKDFF